MSKGWSTKELIKLFSSEVQVESDTDDIYLLDFEENEKIGIGIDGLGNLILIVPGQSKVNAFESKYATFDPWTSVKFRNDGKTLTDIALLKCNKIQGNDLVPVISAIISGLIDLHFSYGRIGEHIWSLKSLFDNGFKNEISESILIGLIGELMAINSSTDSNFMVECWHEDTSGRFDFSHRNNRLEVKSTTLLTRKHNFRSTQIIEVNGMKIGILSVNVFRVDAGLSISDFIEQILAKLNNENQLKIKSIILDTIKAPLQTLDSVYLDEVSTSHSIKLFELDSIPKPAWERPVEQVNWVATLNDGDACEQEYTDFLKL